MIIPNQFFFLVCIKKIHVHCIPLCLSTVIFFETISIWLYTSLTFWLSAHPADKYSCIFSGGQIQWRIQDFPGGAKPLREKGAPTCYLTIFFWKLRENENILAESGVPCAPTRFAEHFLAFWHSNGSRSFNIHHRDLPKIPFYSELNSADF